MPRYLTPNDDVSLPGTVIFLDTESTPSPDQLQPRRQLHRFKLGVAIAGRIENGVMTRRKVLRFRDRSEFWPWVNYVRKHGAPVWLFAHNLGFDLTMLNFWGDMGRGEFRINHKWSGDIRRIRTEKIRRKLGKTKAGLLVTEDPPTCIMCWAKAGWKIVALDSLNYFELPLAKLGNMVGIDKLAMPPHDASWDAWFDYCQRDCEILESALLRYIAFCCKQELGRFAFTLAGQSLAAFRHRWMMEQPELPDDQERRDFERSSLYTGRLDAFWVGGARDGWQKFRGEKLYQQDIFSKPPAEQFHLVDVNSFYGAVMMEQPVPLRCIESALPGEYDKCPATELDETCIARVMIETDSESFPIRTDEGSYFATGRFVTTLAGPELKRAIETDSISQTYAWMRYELGPLFRDYAAGIWKETESALSSGDSVLAYVGKQMLARLSGKFSQRIGAWQNCPESTAVEPWSEWVTVSATTGKSTRYRAIGYDVQVRGEPEDVPNSFPALHAWITSAGREWLLELIRVAGASRVYYCSTDSLIVDDTGLARLDARGMLHPTAIGFLKIQKSSPILEIRGPHHYRIGDKVVIAGKDRSGKMTGRDTYSIARFQSLQETLGRKGPDTIQVDEMEFHIPNRLVRGKIQPGGWVRPVIRIEGEYRCPTALHAAASQ